MSMDSSQLQPVKKRGRKPNTQKNKELQTSSNDAKKQTKEQKNISLQNVQSDSSTICSQTSNQDPLILHLNVSLDDKHYSHPSNEDTISNKSYEKNFFEYNPNINEPLAYEDQNFDKFTSIPEIYKSYKKEPSQRSDVSIKDLFNDNKQQGGKIEIKNKPVNQTNTPNIVLLKDMISNKEWCEQTNYWCYWDCHSFTNPPFGIPIKYKNDKFHVFGCFCSLECAVAYNFYGHENMDNVWENYNLLNMMSNKLNYKFSLHPAISRRCLNTFGGPLSIDQFREKSKSNKKYNILTYPMVSIVEHVEEINESSSYNNKLGGGCFIPLDKSRIEKIEEANKDTNFAKSKTNLEECMKLKFTN